MSDPSCDSVPAAVAEQFRPDLWRDLVQLRRAIHEDPELSFQEERTAARLEHGLRNAELLGPAVGQNEMDHNAPPRGVLSDSIRE